MTFEKDDLVVFDPDPEAKSFSLGNLWIVTHYAETDEPHQRLWIHPILEDAKNHRGRSVTAAQVRPVSDFNVIVNFGSRVVRAEPISRSWSKAHKGGSPLYWRSNGKRNYRIRPHVYERVREAYGGSPVFMSERYQRANKATSQSVA